MQGGECNTSLWFPWDVRAARGQLPSARSQNDSSAQSAVKIKISPFFLPPRYGVHARSLFLFRSPIRPPRDWLEAHGRLNYDLEGSLTVINEEFYAVDRTPRSMGLLLNEFNYNLLSPPPAGSSARFRCCVGQRKKFRSTELSFRLQSGSVIFEIGESISTFRGDWCLRASTG